MSYQGVERRVHRVFVTRNTEYHLRSDYCVAVRDRNTGDWRTDHEALGQRAVAAVTYSPAGGISTVDRTLPDVGQSIFFTRSSDEPLISSPVTEVQRPPKSTVLAYRR
ncbi:MAG: hypothetical protein KC416_08370 [Myxococcales bacterium]|nr:hypothetical protein [Myxococcales bacterium]